MPGLDALRGMLASQEAGGLTEQGHAALTPRSRARVDGLAADFGAARARRRREAAANGGDGGGSPGGGADLRREEERLMAELLAAMETDHISIKAVAEVQANATAAGLDNVLVAAPGDVPDATRFEHEH